MNWVVSFKNSTWLRVNEVTGPIVEERWSQYLAGTLPSNVPPTARVKPIGADDPAKFHYSTVNGVYPEEVWDHMIRERNGDWKCAAAQWHKRGEGCAHKIDPPGASVKKVQDLPTTQSQIPAEKWDQAKRNLDTLKRTGKIGREGISESEAAEIDARIAERRAKVAANREKYGRGSTRLSPRQQALIAAVNKGDE